MDEVFEVQARWKFSRLGGREFFARNLDEGLTHIGGYTFEGLDYIISQAYGANQAWDVYTIPVPRKEENLPLVRALLDCAVWANVRDGKIHMVFIPGTTSWGEMFKLFGASVTNEPKVAKRMAGLMAGRALSHWTTNLNVKEVAQDAFATEDFGDDTEMLLDGAGVIRRSLFETMVFGWHERVRDTYPQFRVESMAARFERAIMVNLRAYTSRGLLKGNFFIMDDDEMDGLYDRDCHLVVAEGSFKAGVTMPEGHNFVTAEVQEWHPHLFTDVQTMINLRPAFTSAHMVEVTKDYFDALRNVLDTPRGEAVDFTPVMGHVADLVNKQVDAIRDGDGDWRDLRIRWNAAEWVARGLDIRDSESLLRGVVDAKARVILQEPERGKSKFRIPVPAAWYMQVVSESAAKMYGYRGKVKTGEARVWWLAKLVVLSDRDWVNHYVRFGGHDLDDFFKVLFRTIDGVRSLLIVRSPNELGGYGVFKWHEGDRAPVWRKANGDVEVFPVIKGSLPKPIDQAIADGDTIFSELENEVSDLYTGEFVSRDDIWAKIEGSVEKKASAGMLVNAVMFWALVMRTPVPVGYGTLEAYIDWTTQEDLSPKAAVDLRFLATVLVAAAVNSGKPIDKKFWEDRNMASGIQKLLDNGVVEQPNLVDKGEPAFLSVRFRHIREEAQKFLVHAHDVANDARPPVGLEELGALRLGTWGNLRGVEGTFAAMYLRLFRRDMYVEFERARSRMTREDREAGRTPQLSDAQWRNLYNGLHMKLVTTPSGRIRQEHEVFNFVLALGLATYKFRKGHLYCQVKGCRNAASGSLFSYKGEKYQTCFTHGRQLKVNAKLAEQLEKAEFSDQPLTGSDAVFHLYMEAMERFGVAAPLGTDQLPYDGWLVTCSSCGREHTFVDAVKYQEFLVNGSVCKRCLSQQK